jgi:hypothetical protein
LIDFRARCKFFLFIFHFLVVWRDKKCQIFNCTPDFFVTLQGFNGNHVKRIKIDFVRDARALFAAAGLAHSQGDSRSAELSADSTGEGGL